MHNHRLRLPWVSLPNSFLFAVEVGIELISKAIARIVESKLLIQLINLINIRLLKFKRDVEILSDSLWRLGLGNHRTAMGDAPGCKERVS